MCNRATQRDKLREDVKFHILRLLQHKPEINQRELTQGVGVRTGGIHYVFNALTEKGLQELSNFNAAEDKRRYGYKLAQQGMAERAQPTRRFVIRKLAEYAALKGEIEGVQGELSKQELAEIRAVSNMGGMS